MRVLAIALATILFASALVADDAATKNATDFLAGLKELKPSIYGKNSYKAKYMGRKLGGLQLEVSESKYEEGPCYRVDATFQLSFGEKWYKMTQTAYVSHGLQLLFRTQTAVDTNEPAEHETTQLTPDGYVKSEVEDGELKVYKHATAERQLEDEAELLMLMLLPRDEVKSYEFQSWSSSLGLHAYTYTVEGEKKIGELTGTLIRAKHKKMKKDDKGKETIVDVEDTYLLSEKGVIIRITGSDAPFTLEFDDGRYTKEEVKQMASPLDPVLAFWMALRDKDVELLKIATNEGRYLEEVRKREENDEVAEWEKKFLKEYAEEKLCPAMLENVDLKDHLKLMIDGLSASWFEVKMDGGTKAKVGFSPEFAKTTGDKSVMWWHIERNTETGKWEMVYLETEEDEF